MEGQRGGNGIGDKRERERERVTGGVDEHEGGCMRRTRPGEAGRELRSSGGGKTISFGEKSGGCGEKSVAAKERKGGGPWRR